MKFSAKNPRLRKAAKRQVQKEKIMPCNHRFREDLYPDYRLKYLFVGSFNPGWNNPNGNNATWFYGRRSNSFWRIMPNVFGHDNMNKAYYRRNTHIWKSYCTDNGIGITDMIEIIFDANEPEHQQLILGFQDDQIESFRAFRLTDIPGIIEKNSKSLCGVYLTRYCHTLDQGGIFSRRWNEIVGLCKNLEIHSACLVTPSNGYMMPVNEKIKEWQKEIIICA